MLPYGLNHRPRQVNLSFNEYILPMQAIMGNFRSKGHDEHQQNSYQRRSPFSVKAPLSLGFFHIPIPEMKQLYNQKIVGQFQEAIACSSVNSGVLKRLVGMNNIKAIFIGHDHTNDFCGNLDGIWFCYGGGSGYHGYGKEGWPRRARVILAQLSKQKSTWTSLERITTWKRLDDEMLSKFDEQVLWNHNS